MLAHKLSQQQSSSRVPTDDTLFNRHQEIKLNPKIETNWQLKMTAWFNIWGLIQTLADRETDLDQEN